MTSCSLFSDVDEKKHTMPRNLLILAIILPIAGLIGYLLADPMQMESMAAVGLIISVLLFPLALKWHHPALVFSWNASVIVFFLPGEPYLWMFLGLLSLGLTVLHRFLEPQFKPLNVPSITWSLLVLAIVVCVTAKLTGGVGIRSFGSSVYGGKKYIFIWFAILGYFALSMRAIPPEKAMLYSVAFFVGSITTAFSTLAYVIGPGAWILYSIFPTDYAMQLAAKDFGMTSVDAISRFSGFGPAGIGLVPILLIRYGVRGLLDWHRPWRMGLLMLLVGMSLLGGFRSTLVYVCLLIAVQFFIEGLHRTRWLAIALGFSLVTFLGACVVAPKLPMSVQRSLSVIPMIPVSDHARSDAELSSDWRKAIWKRVMPEIERHFWMGKGVTASARNYYLENQAYRSGIADEYDMTILAGDYHNGPLTLIIPFGIWGVLAFAAFLIAGFRVLWRNCHAGSGMLPNINRTLLAVFLAKVIFFFFVFGSFATEFYTFAGLIALSVSLNGGIRRESTGQQLQATASASRVRN